MQPPAKFGQISKSAHAWLRGRTRVTSLRLQTTVWSKGSSTLFNPVHIALRFEFGNFVDDLVTAEKYEDYYQNASAEAVLCKADWAVDVLFSSL